MQNNRQTHLLQGFCQDVWQVLKHWHFVARLFPPLYTSESCPSILQVLASIVAFLQWFFQYTIDHIRPVCPLRKWTISCLARWRMTGPRFPTQNRRMELEFTTTKTSIPLKAADMGTLKNGHLHLCPPNLSWKSGRMRSHVYFSSIISTFMCTHMLLYMCM